MMATTSGSESATDFLRCVRRGPLLRLAFRAAGASAGGGDEGAVGRVKSMMGKILGEGSRDLGSSRGSDVRMRVLSLLMPIPEAAQKRSIAGIARLNSAGRLVELAARSSAAARG